MFSGFVLTMIQSLIVLAMIMLCGFAGQAVRNSEEGWVLGGVTGILLGSALATWLAPYLDVITRG